ncbi:MAG: protease modulator HflC [Acidobacteriota bacterium]
MMVRVFGLLFLIIALAAVSASVFVVNEYEQIVVTRFGKVVDRNPSPEQEAVLEPGLNFKVPFVDQVNRFEKRFLEWDGKVTQVPTKEKRFILVDTYARWRISDAVLFYKRLKDERGAQRRLDGILDGETRDSIARHDLVELVRTSNRKPQYDEAQLAEEETTELEPIQIGRDAIRDEILRNAQLRVADLGIEILDVQFKRINYVREVQETVFDRMIAERRRIADRFRSEGEGEASRIRGDKERELKSISSDAFRRAQEIIGLADAEATTIYAEAYDQSSASRDLYAFLKSLETYRQTVSDDTVMVLSTDSELYGYLRSSRGQ